MMIFRRWTTTRYAGGLPTVHVKFGEDMAILAGDALLNFAFETACQGFAVKPGDANVEKAFAVLAKKSWYLWYGWRTGA